MWSGQSFDILKLDLDQVKHWYRYHHVEGTEYPIPDLDDFLTSVSGEVQRLKLLFFDVKNPFWDEDNRELYGAALGALLRRYPVLPERLIVANASRKILESLKEALRQSGEERCEFAFDAAGSFGAMLGFKKNPLEVARDRGTPSYRLARDPAQVTWGRSLKPRAIVTTTGRAGSRPSFIGRSMTPLICTIRLLRASTAFSPTSLM